MIPDAYDLKRIVRAHRARFWLRDLLEGFEFAPVWRFADQAQFDSDDVDALARRLAAGPQRLPHPETIFELADRSRTIRSQIVYARQRDDGIGMAELIELDEKGRLLHDGWPEGVFNEDIDQARRLLAAQRTRSRA